MAAPSGTPKGAGLVKVGSVSYVTRGTQAVMALLVLFSLVVACTSIHRSELGVSGRGIVSSSTSVQWVVLVAGFVTAIEGAVALMMLVRGKRAAARRALYVSAITGLVGLIGTVLSVIGLVLLRREEG